MNKTLQKQRANHILYCDKQQELNTHTHAHKHAHAHAHTHTHTHHLKGMINKLSKDKLAQQAGIRSEWN